LIDISYLNKMHGSCFTDSWFCACTCEQLIKICKHYSKQSQNKDTNSDWRSVHNWKLFHRSGGNIAWRWRWKAIFPKLRGNNFQ